MILSEFKLRPLPASKFHTRIRIFDTKKNMERAAVADGSMTGTAQACHCGFTKKDNKGDCIGEIYLHVNPTLRLDAIHELTHAAVHYVREIRHGNLSEPNNGEYASAAEELLCRSMEAYVGEFFVHLARFPRGLLVVPSEVPEPGVKIKFPAGA